MTSVCSGQYTSVLRPSFSAKLFLTGINGLATIGQIKDGKYMYRALEAHVSLYLAFYKLHIRSFIDDNQKIEKELKEVVINAIFDVSEYVKEKKKAHVKHNHKFLLDVMRSIKFTALQDTFDKSLKNHVKKIKFHRIYMKPFKAVLLFIRATRE